MMQLYFKTTKLFKNSEPLTRKALEEKTLSISSFRYYFQKNRVMAKKLHTNQKPEKERKSFNSRIQIESWSIVMKAYLSP